MAKKSKKSASRAVAKLPAGFTAVATGGSFGAWHDFHKQPVLTGKVVELGSFEQEQEYTDAKGKKKSRTVDRQTMTVEQANKVLSTVSDSYALKGLFEMGKKLKGKVVFLRFDGQKKLKGGKKVNEFTVAVK